MKTAFEPDHSASDKQHTTATSFATGPDKNFLFYYLSINLIIFLKLF